MPSPKGGCQLRRGGSGNVMEKEKNRKGKLSAKAMSFHSGMMMSSGGGGEVGGDVLRRPRTVPDLISGGGKNVVVSSETDARPAKLTKLLLNVTIQRSLGAVQVLISPESTVEDLIAAALRQYIKEGRRPILPVNDPACFDLHYSQFSLESLRREEKLINLGSRNFFLCPKPSIQETASSTSCSKQAGKAVKSGSPWLKIMEFLL